MILPRNMNINIAHVCFIQFVYTVKVLFVINRIRYKSRERERDNFAYFAVVIMMIDFGSISFYKVHSKKKIIKGLMGVICP